MMKQKIKNLKPIEYDIHFKYQCKCSQHHWVTYNEASEPDFIIVCDCKRILKLKPVSKFLIKYQKPNHNTIDKNSTINDSPIVIVPQEYHIKEETETVTSTESMDIISTPDPIDHEPQEQDKINVESTSTIQRQIPTNLLNTCANLLVTFGYNKREAVDIVNTFYYSNLDIEQSQFVKLLLISIGRSNANHFASDKV